MTPSADEENDQDIALMARVACGDHQAFADLVEKYQHAVVGTVVKMLGNRTEAEDVAQQVFLRLWKSAKRYQPTAKFTTYLFTITRNLVFNTTRRQTVRKESPLEDQEEWDQRVQDRDSSKQPDLELDHKELREAVDAAVAALPEKQRMAVILRRYEQMPYEEIALVLDLSVSAVKSQLFRARTQLREQLSKFLDD